MTCGEYIGGLLHAVTVAHVLHLQATGPGSYARHVAMGDLYEGLGSKVDDLAEAYQGAYGLIDGYPASFDLPDTEPGIWVKSLSEFVRSNRSVVGDDSELQNLVDEILSLIDKTHYRVTFLE